MTALHSLLRISILIALFSVGLLALFAMPLDDSPLWLASFLFSKTLAFAALWLFYKLNSRWVKTDKWLVRFAAMNEKSLEK